MLKFYFKVLVLLTDLDKLNKKNLKIRKMEAVHAKATEIFHALDKDQSGFLDNAEVKTGLQILYAEHPISDEDAQRTIESVDSNSDGKMSFEEFLNLILKHQS